MKNISNYNLKLLFIQLFPTKHFDLTLYLTKYICNISILSPKKQPINEDIHHYKPLRFHSQTFLFPKLPIGLVMVHLYR